MPPETLRLLIWGKTSPELSQQYVETVCTAGVREDGCPVRLYPVPLRYLREENRYQLYDVIEVRGAKSKSDPRPESYRIEGESIVRISHIDTDKQGWAKRRQWLFKDQSWQFSNMGALKQAEAETHRSLGIIKPGKIEGVRVVRKPADEEAQFRTKMRDVVAQGKLFLAEHKDLEYLPFEIKLKWRCGIPCDECSASPHDMKVLDWGLNELARRQGSEKAKQRLEDITMSGNYELSLFMGNFRLHRRNFSIVGLWYPKRQAQAALSF